MRAALRFYSLLLTLCVLLQARSFAQQTVFNVPSADVTPAGKIFLQHESQFRPYPPRSFWLGTHYTALGIGHNTELTATLFNVSAPHSGEIDLGLGFKSAIPILKKRFAEREVKVIIGQEVIVPLQQNTVGDWTFGALSARLPKANTRLTGGVSYGTPHLFGKHAVSFIGAIEQPVTKRFSLIADWYSGDNSYGLFIPGIQYQLPKSINVFVGYQIPNRGNTVLPSGFVFEIGKIFR